MLSIKQNLLETIRGGSPDRFVKGFEFYHTIWNSPIMDANPILPPIGGEVTDGWGVTIAWPEGAPGPFPTHDNAHKVLKDITRWKDVVRHPPVIFPEEEWNKYLPEIEAIDTSEVFASAFRFPGIFEQAHYLMGMTETLYNFAAEPDFTRELIDYIVDYNVKCAEEVTKYYKPEMLFQSDDWGSSTNSFFSPKMFREFLLPGYKKIFKAWRDGGTELIVHHSDSYAANLVPLMIELGIDIWQGVLTSNNIPELIKQYGGQISFMGGVDCSVVDIKNWTPELIENEVRFICQACGTKYFIPCLTMGGEPSVYPGVSDCVREKIDLVSQEMF